jgi:ribosomal protein S18 acetylase RimI-like enzyme
VARLDGARAQGIADAPLTAYLQVGADNVPAVSLYRSLGFADAYAYHYRIGPA